MARVVKRLGGEACLFVAEGGLTGKLLLRLIEEEGLEYRSFAAKEWTRENLTVYEESSGLQYRFVMPGPALRKDELERLMQMLITYDPAPDYVVASGSLPPGLPDHTYADITRIFKKKGSKVIVDTSGPALPAAVREGVFLIKPNLNELQELAGREIESEDSQEEFAKEIVSKGGAEIVVTSLGAGGALLVTKDGAERVRTPTVPIRSKVGAGDSMVGGIVLSLARGYPVRDAVRFGVAAGAAAVMTPGSELAGKGDTERLYRQIREQRSGHP